METKDVIITGDLNVAHKKIDIFNKAFYHHAGLTIEERNSFDNLLDLGLIDSFRLLHPDLVKYSYFHPVNRGHNKGWRIDYFLTPKSFKNKIFESNIMNEYSGSDHCPVVLMLKGNLK